MATYTEKQANDAGWQAVNGKYYKPFMMPVGRVILLSLMMTPSGNLYMPDYMRESNEAEVNWHAMDLQERAENYAVFMHVVEGSEKDTDAVKAQISDYQKTLTDGELLIFNFTLYAEMEKYGMAVRTKKPAPALTKTQKLNILFA
jgi:hypothetical protein